MLWSVGKYIIGVVGVLALVGVLWFRAAAFQAERDTARAELVTMRNAFETEKISTATAVDAANRATVNGAEDSRRCQNALTIARTETAKLRKTVASCQTPEAVAKRLGGLFPGAPVTP